MDYGWQYLNIGSYKVWVNCRLCCVVCKFWTFGIQNLLVLCGIRSAGRYLPQTGVHILQWLFTTFQSFWRWWWWWRSHGSWRWMRYLREDPSCICLGSAELQKKCHGEKESCQLSRAVEEIHVWFLLWSWDLVSSEWNEDEGFVCFNFEVYM